MWVRRKWTPVYSLQPPALRRSRLGGTTLRVGRITILHKERRRTKRFRLDLLTRFRIIPPSHPDKASSFLAAQIYDLSEGGMRILTNTVHAEGLHIFHATVSPPEQCILEIRIVDLDPPLTIHGKVVWYDKMEQDPSYEFQIGLEFVNLTKDQQETIRTILKILKKEA